MDGSIDRLMLYDKWEQRQCHIAFSSADMRRKACFYITLMILARVGISSKEDSDFF